MDVDVGVGYLLLPTGWSSIFTTGLKLVTIMGLNFQQTELLQ